VGFCLIKLNKKDKPYSYDAPYIEISKCPIDDTGVKIVQVLSCCQIAGFKTLMFNACHYTSRARYRQNADNFQVLEEQSRRKFVCIQVVIFVLLLVRW
jgi:hypothetical protein